MFRVILRHYLSNKPDMKRILKIVYSSIIILIVPFSMALGQDKKSEHKIKIIVDDGSGSKVIIDTVYKDSSAPDSMKLKDGSVVYLKHGKTFDVYVSENENESTTEKARYA